jgi:hypothetical protein
VTQLFDLNARIQQLTWSLIFYEKYSTSLSTIVLVVLTTANFGEFSNFCRYYTRSQAGKSTGYRPTLKPLIVAFPFHTRLSSCVKFNRSWCSHACLLFVMVRKLSGLIRHWKAQSEFRMVLHYNMKTIMRNGYELPEKMKTSHFFLIGHLGRYLCCFYLTFTFFIGKSDKTDSFQ